MLKGTQYDWNDQQKLKGFARGFWVIGGYILIAVFLMAEWSSPDFLSQDIPTMGG